jgi:hypothetical protein
MPSTTFYTPAASTSQTPVVVRKRCKIPTPADLHRLAKVPVWFDTEKEARNTLHNAGFTCTPQVIEKLLSTSKFIWMRHANRAHNIFVQGPGDAPELTCRLPNLLTRTGRCYELAYRGCSQGNDWTVIHGETIGPRGFGRMGHAWLENSGWVYDPVLDRTMRSDAYAMLVQAVVLKRFTVWEMHNEAAKCGHYGPW